MKLSCQCKELKKSVELKYVLYSYSNSLAVFPVLKMTASCSLQMRTCNDLVLFLSKNLASFSNFYMYMYNLDLMLGQCKQYVYQSYSVIFVSLLSPTSRTLVCIAGGMLGEGALLIVAA